MSSQQFSKLNFLSATQRRFYTRKKPSSDQFSQDQGIFKIVKVLNTSSTMRKINKYQFLKTQPSHKFSEDHNFNEPEFIKKEIKAKIQLLLKKSDKKWKILFSSYNDLKSCSSTETFSIQQNKFLIAFADLLKESTDDIRNSTQMAKTCAKQNTEDKKEKTDFKINLQKIKLIKENEILRKKCFQASFDNSHRRPSAFEQFVNLPVVQEKQQKQKAQESDSIVRLKLKINQLNQKIYSVQNQNIKLNQSLAISEDSLKLMKQDKEAFAKKNDELKIQNENLCAEFVNLRLQNENSTLKIQRWRAIISFQREEILSYETELAAIKNQYKDLMRKYKILVKKMNSMSSKNESSIGSTGFGNLRQSESLNAKYFENFREQLETFGKVRTIFSSKESENTLDKSNTLTQKRNSCTGNTDKYKNFLGEKQTLSNKSGVKKLSREHYAFFKPNFYNFVQTYMDIHGIDHTNMEQLGGEFDLNCEFLTTIRAILDCKFNDFLNQDFTKTSSLPNFTYAWLSKYKINRKQKKIVPVKGDLDKEVIPNFFMNLMSQKLNYNWEIITFREFLMESLTLDELYFYLMARNWILQGDLLENVSGVYQEIYYISIAQAVNMLQKFIADVNFRKRIQEYIKRLIVYVRKRPLIDVHFVLRILLEYYQSKKHQQFTNLVSLAELLSKQKVATFTFQYFLKIFEYNFNYLSMTQKLQIYRKCFSCSRGKINLQVILTVLSEEGYLCKEVKKIFCNDPITVTKDQTKAEDVPITFEQDLPQMMLFEQFFQRFYRESYEEVKLKMGLQYFEKTMESVKDFNQMNIFSRIELVFNICLSTMRKAFYTKSIFSINLEISLIGFLPILQEIVGMLKRFSKITCEKNSILDLMAFFKRQTAAKKILRFYRKKRNQMHRNFIFGVKDEVIEENQKIQGVRKEFNFLIENLKDKFSEKKIILNEYEA